MPRLVAMTLASDVFQFLLDYPIHFISNTGWIVMVGVCDLKL